MRRPLAKLGITAAVAIVVVAGYLATRTPTETYTPVVAGVVVASEHGAGYMLAGHDGWVSVGRFVVDGPPEVGDLLLAGEGSPTWGYAAVAWGAGCWKATGRGLVTGQSVDLDTGGIGSRPGVAIHLLLAKSPAFVGPVGSDGKLLGDMLCLDSEGRVVSDH